jgi:transcription antitermination factor NusG
MAAAQWREIEGICAREGQADNRRDRAWDQWDCWKPLESCPVGLVGWNMVDAATNERWYVLRSKPRKEATLFRFAQQHGHRVFYPRIPVKPVNPRASKVRPYFPGYMFVYTDLETVGESTFRWMPFSGGLVHVGGSPADVAEMTVAAIRTRIAEIWEAGGLKFDGLKKGEKVLVREGMFEGYEGIFDATLSGRQRVRVFLKMLNDRFVPVELDAGTIEKLKRSS